MMNKLKENLFWKTFFCYVPRCKLGSIAYDFVICHLDTFFSTPLCKNCMTQFKSVSEFRLLRQMSHE